VDTFVSGDDRQVSWSEGLKAALQRGQYASLDEAHLRASLYRPFTHSHLYFDRTMTERRYQMPTIFPTPGSEAENRAICLTDCGSEKPFMVAVSAKIPDLHLVGAGSSTQCFPFYTYAADGTARADNITGWALDHFRAHYGDDAISRWDIFHYAYALLHHPTYRQRYAANLRRDLPRIPLAPAFSPFAQAGRRLATLHTEYEAQPEYPLQWVETPGAPLDLKVRKMRLSADKTALVYNDYLTLAGIPAAAFDYRLGNRSALDWVIDQYRVSADARSAIVNDPNRPDDPRYILRLIGQVITVSLETVQVVADLPPLD
jgi:predicted helicase